MKNWPFLICLGLTLAACGSQPETSAETKREVAGARTNHDLGKKLFYEKCASCHMVNKELTGPALRGAEQRWPDKQKLYAFIRNSDSVIQTDAYARQLWLQYNQTRMTAHPDLTDAQIAAILAYVQSVAVNP